MIIALVLGIIVPTTYLLFRNTSESNVQILYSQISQIGNNIVDTAETVFFSGEGSKIVLEVNMPKGVKKHQTVIDTPGDSAIILVYQPFNHRLTQTHENMFSASTALRLYRERISHYS